MSEFSTTDESFDMRLSETFTSPTNSKWFVDTHAHCCCIITYCSVPSYLIIYVNIMQCQCVLTSYFIICAPVAVIKYWGKHDVKLNTPMNSSASLTLDQVVHASLVAWICIATLCITIAFFIMNIIHTNTRLIQNIMSLDNDDGDNDDDVITESVYIYTLLICRRIFTQSRQLLRALTTRLIACG